MTPAATAIGPCLICILSAGLLSYLVCMEAMRQLEGVLYEKQLACAAVLCPPHMGVSQRHRDICIPKHGVLGLSWLWIQVDTPLG